MLYLEYRIIQIAAKEFGLSVPKYIQRKESARHPEDKVTRCMICSCCDPARSNIYRDICNGCFQQYEKKLDKKHFR